MNKSHEPPEEPRTAGATGEVLGYPKPRVAPPELVRFARPNPLS